MASQTTTHPTETAAPVKLHPSAASQGLACWLHHGDRVALHAPLRLRPEQRLLLAQALGHPAYPAEAEVRARP